MEKTDLEELVNSCYTKSDVCRALGYPLNGTGMKKVQALIEAHELSTEHFDPYRKHRARKYPLIEKPCPARLRPVVQSTKGCSKRANDMFKGLREHIFSARSQ